MAITDSESTPLTHIRDRIAAAARLSGTAAADVTLIAVSKTRSAAEIAPLIAQGHRVFGENRVQEAEAKWPILRATHPDIELHMVGQLQSNKADAAVALFDAIHSVDRLSLIKALGKAMTAAGRTIPCFLQVNIGAEPQKGGCTISDIGDLLAAAADHGVPIIGLMCVPPASVEAAPYFALLAEHARRNDIAQTSMGMSEDFETAIMLGANHVRVGSALFGARW